MKMFPAILLCSALLALSYQVPRAGACTSMVIPAADGGYLYGRTLEFGADLKSNLIVVPRKVSITGSTPEKGIGKGGMEWKAKYGVIGTNFFDFNLLIEGVNEKGLAGGLFYFPNYAGFMPLPDGKAAESIGNTDFVTYVLTNFATVDEVREGITNLVVTGIPLAPLGNIVPPIHFIFHDPSGKSISVEYLDGGRLSALDNPARVFTNAPDLTNQLSRLSEYSVFTRGFAAPLDVNGTKMPALGTGVGANILPGGFTPPARFVRAFYIQQNAPVPPTSEAGVPLLFHLMNGFDVPAGLVGETASDAKPFEYEITEWTSVIDMKNLRYYIRTFENSDVRFVDLNKVDLDAKEFRVIKIDQKQNFADLSQ